MDIDEILEKEMLIDAPRLGKWKPDTNLLMYLASFDDWGAAEESINKNKQQMIAEGLSPQKIKFRLMVHVEYIDS